MITSIRKREAAVKAKAYAAEKALALARQPVTSLDAQEGLDHIDGMRTSPGQPGMCRRILA